MSVKIVVIEDDVWMSEYYSRILVREGYEVFVAVNALDAIDVIDKQRPNVLLMDMLLTGSTALALLHELQSHADLASIPVVLATNLAEQIKIDDVKGYGVQRILDKATMQPSDIAAAIRGAVS